MLRLFTFLIAVLALPADSVGQMPPGPDSASSQSQVLCDFRKDPVLCNLREDGEVPQRVRNQVEILNAVFSSCPISKQTCAPDSVGDDLGRCNIAPTVISALAGAFTAPGEKQMAYLVNVGECSLNRELTTARLAVFSDTKMIVNADVRAKDILGAYDLEHTGKQQLLLISGGSGMGELTLKAQLVEFAKDGLSIVAEFDEVYLDSCNSLDSDSVRAAVISFLPAGKGQSPKFTKEWYRTNCQKPTQGRKLHWTRCKSDGDCS